MNNLRVINEQNKITFPKPTGYLPMMPDTTHFEKKEGDKAEEQLGEVEVMIKDRRMIPEPKPWGTELKNPHI